MGPSKTLLQLLVPSLMLLVTGLYIFDVWGQKFEVAALGLLLGVIMVPLLLIEIGKDFVRARDGGGTKSDSPEAPQQWPAFAEAFTHRARIALVAVVIYVVLIPRVGYALATFAFVTAFLAALRRSSLREIVVVGVGLPLIAYTVFEVLLRVGISP